jgi:pSer/pThr/pTyr-binding forkhead associated (FHA) protein
VNGRRLKRAKLRPGDTITIGATELVFRRESVT